MHVTQCVFHGMQNEGLYVGSPWCWDLWESSQCGSLIPVDWELSHITSPNEHMIDAWGPITTLHAFQSKHR